MLAHTRLVFILQVAFLQFTFDVAGVFFFWQRDSLVFHSPLILVFVSRCQYPVSCALGLMCTSASWTWRISSRIDSWCSGPGRDERVSLSQAFEARRTASPCVAVPWKGEAVHTRPSTDSRALLTNQIRTWIRSLSQGCSNVVLPVLHTVRTCPAY